MASAARQADPELSAGDRMDTVCATEFIRSAERFMASGKFALAQEQLANAQTLDPSNRYIPAILDRLQILQHAPPSPPDLETLPQGAGSDSQRYLSVTVGTEFKSGVKSAEEWASDPPQQMQTRIRRLTNAAESFLESGSLKNAFESLMKAYLLDPMSPYVIACESTVLPAWEQAQCGSAAGTPLNKELGLENLLRSSPIKPER